MRKNVYYNIYRRKWENDIVNCEFDKFIILPKQEILVDGHVHDKNIKEKLKEIDLINKMNKVRKCIKKRYYKFIPREKVNNIENYDACIMPQLFLKPYRHKKPYVVYIENSHSIFDYNYEDFESLNKRNKIIIELKKIIEDEYFKGFIFFSQRSKVGFYKYFSGVIDENYKYIDVIYPMIKDTKRISKEFVENKINTMKKSLNLIFVSSIFSLKGGCEIIEMYKRLKSTYNITITFITEEGTIPKKYLSYINSEENLKIVKNNLTSEQLRSYLESAHILLHPTYMDSTAIVVMEALISCTPVIATDTFAIPEYIDNGLNGYIFENPIKYWDDEYKPLKPYRFFGTYETANYITNIKNSTIHRSVVDNLANYVEECYHNYENIIYNCYDKMKTYEFSEEITKAKWERAINDYLLN